MSQDERLAKAKQKLMNMNRKVQRATEISKKHQIGKSPVTSPSKIPPKQVQKKSNDYVFELTEQMVNLGFSDEIVVEYVGSVEENLKLTDRQLEQKEASLLKKLKKINQKIDFIKNPDKVQSPRPPKRKEEPVVVEKSEASPTKQEKGYLEIMMARKTPTKEAPKPKTPVVKSIPKPQKKKSEPEPEPNPGAVKATGAGAQFLASLADDL